MDDARKRQFEELAEVERNNKDEDLLAAEVVAFASDPDTALHAQFEWDDSAAAHQHRLWQARKIIKVYVEYEPNVKADVSVWVSVPSHRARPGGGYSRRKKAMADPKACEELLADALRKLQHIRREYHMLKKLANVFSAIDDALADAQTEKEKQERKAKKTTPKTKKTTQKKSRGRSSRHASV